MESRCNKSNLLAYSTAILLTAYAAPAFALSNSAEYTVNGTTVTGAGTSSTAFFNGTSGVGYDVTIQTGANLNSPNGTDQIRLDHGTVTNQSGATIANTGGANNVHFTGTNATGTLNNAGTISTGGNYGVVFEGNGNFNNSGTVAQSFVVGVNILGSANVVNSGTVYEGVYGNAFGISVGGGVLNFNNTVSGLLRSNAGGNCYGSGLQAGSTGGQAHVMNAGTINSLAACGDIQGIGLSGFTSGDILNSGTISGNSNGGVINVYGIDIRGGSNLAITNSGTLSPTSNGAAFGISLQGSSRDIAVSNSNLINAISTGTESHGIYVDTTSHDIAITNTGTIHASGGSMVSSGIHSAVGSTGVTINNNAGTITGDDYGVFLGSSNSTITATAGSDIEGGTAAIGLAGTGDVVNIRGQSQIVGVIEGNTATPGTPLTGNKLNFIFSGLTIPEISNFKTAISTAGNGSGSVTLGSNTYSWDSFSSVNLGAISNQLQTQVDSGLRNIAGRISSLPNVLSADYDSFYLAATNNPESALNSLTGRQLISAYSTMGVGNARALSELSDNRASILQNEQSGSEVKGGGGGMLSTMMLAPSMGAHEPARSKWSAWIDNSVTFTNQDTTSDGAGYHGTIETPTIGLDYRAAPDLTIGGLAHVQVANSDFKDGSHARLQNALLGAYGVYSHDSWFGNGLLGVGYNDYANKRIALNGQTAEGSPAGEELLANIGGGYNFKHDGWNLAPVAGLQYTYIGVDSYHEEGAGAMNLKVSDQDINSLRTKLGAQLSSSFTISNLKLTPSASASWYHDLLDGNNKVDESLSGAPELGSFGVQSTNSDRDFAMLGVGLSAKPIETNQDITFYANYSGQVSSNYNANTVYGGVKIGF